MTIITNHTNLIAQSRNIPSRIIPSEVIITRATRSRRRTRTAICDEAIDNSTNDEENDEFHDRSPFICLPMKTLS